MTAASVRGYPPRRIQSPLTTTVRAGEWWEYKLAPIFAAMYGTALMLQAAVSSLWLTLLVALLSLVPGAAYVSVINDLTDREDDLAAGKPNRLAGRSPLFAGALVALTAGAGIAFCILWRGDALLLSVYLAAWLAFSLYSLPPFRWKPRGILGVLCDASGAHLFPTLVAVVLTFRGAGRPIDLLWLIAIGTWAFTNGLRGILWHQLTDVDNDLRSGVRTFAARHPALAARMGAFVFAIELAAFAALLWRMRSPWPVLFLAAYALLVNRRVVRWQMNVVIAAPRERFLIAMHEYYDAFLPVAILIASALRHPLDLIVLALHLLAFPSRVRQVLRDVVKLLKEWRYRRWFKDKAVPLSAATIDFDAPAIAVDPFPTYDLLRASGPVQFLARHNAWVVLGYDELRAAFAMPQLLSNQPYEDVDAVLLAADPPEHTAIRRITSRYFTREIIEAIGRAAAEAAPRLLETRRLEVVRDYAEPLSELAASQLIGLDEGALHDVRAAGAHFSDFAKYVGDLRALAHRAAMYERLRGDGLNETQARSLVALFWVASTKTTERVIAAAAFRLVQHDEVRSELQRDPALLGKYIDEVLRLHQPEPMLRRLAKAPVELGGKTIPAGSMVYLSLAAANRDPARYEQPHELRLDRGASGHLSFGHGIHYCIGATLAKTVVEAAVRELLAEGRDVRLAQPAESIRWQASMMVLFLESLALETRP